MKIENGKIKECTDAELRAYWLARGYDDFMSYPDYRAACERAGTIVREVEHETNTSK